MPRVTQRKLSQSTNSCSSLEIKFIYSEELAVVIWLESNELGNCVCQLSLLHHLKDQGTGVKDKDSI